MVAAFQQNALQRVNVGDEAEVLFKAIPGRVFKAKVGLVIDAIAAGQLQTTGALRTVEGLPEGRALVKLDLVDNISGYHVPPGSAGEAAIYTEHFHELSLLRKIPVFFWDAVQNWSAHEKISTLYPALLKVARRQISTASQNLRRGARAEPRPRR